MKIENIEEGRILIAQRERLLDVLDKSDKWKSGHFEFAEHCGDRPRRISLANFPELQAPFIDIIKKNVELIEKRLEEL